MDASWLNVGSLLLGLAALLLPVVGAFLRKRGRLVPGIFAAASGTACAFSLLCQLYYTNYLVEIRDYSALLDTSGAVAGIGLQLVLLVLIANGAALVAHWLSGWKRDRGQAL